MSQNKIVTVWEVWEYDVWGNDAEGYDVNDRFCVNRRFEIPVTLETANTGTPQEFIHAGLTDKQVRQALHRQGTHIIVEGDDIAYYVTRAGDSYPLGELLCVSHASLSPVREYKYTPSALYALPCKE